MTSPPQPESPVRPARLTGIDVARGVAILGMFAAHLGNTTWGEAADPSWLMIFDGRSSALFAFLAGVSLALATGRRNPPTGPAMRAARASIVYRAGLLLILGVLLVALDTPILIILPAYAAMFVLALPFLGASRGWALVGAAIAMFLSPVLIFLLTTPRQSEEHSWLSRATGLEDPVTLPFDVFATGPYAALIFSAYVLLGLAVGRSDLTSAAFQAAMVLGGAALATLAWGSSRLLLDAGVGTDSPLLHRLISGEPHDYSPVEVAGNAGTALAVTGAFLLLTSPGVFGQVVSLVLAPVAAVGALSLTVYSAHIVAIAILGNDVVWYPESNRILLAFIAVALVGALAWRQFVGQGPLERLLRRLT